jgi:hypothetical protein
MAILTYFLAASQDERRLTKKDIEAFVMDLLHEGMVTFPAALLVGEARNMTSSHWEGAGYYEHARAYIVPNHPEPMLDYTREKAPSSNLLWYSGSDEQAFLALLNKMPLGEKDGCLCFAGLHPELAKRRWDGATIYPLTQPFPMEFCDPMGIEAYPLVDHPLAQYLLLSSRVGSYMRKNEKNPLETVLTRYFGPDLLIRQTVSDPTTK